MSSGRAAWAEATSVETTDVPMAPANCCSVLMTALPSAFFYGGSCRNPLVMEFPTENPWPKAKNR